MKLELEPQINSVTQRTGPGLTNAGISKDGQVRWLYENAYLEVLHPCTNSIIASWRFGKVLRDEETSISAVTDIHTRAGLLLLVATSGSDASGRVHIFSLRLRKVIRSIQVPKKITALETVFANEAEDVSPWIISKHLQYFCGLLAVGTDGGYIYLVDLCLDEIGVHVTDETEPKSLMVITPRMVDPVAKREQAHGYDQHLALLLDDQCHSQGQFYYRRQDDTVQKVFDEDLVWVSSLSYVEQAGTLAVGFSFGSFQLWKLYNPVLDYSSRFNPENLPVTNFVVQEPENDPENFVYLWVVYDDSLEDSVSTICLYQLAYAKKDAYASFGIFFDELKSVCPRLDHRLVADPYSSDGRGTIRSSVVCSFTLRNPLYTPPAVLSDSFEDGINSDDLSLSIFVWRVDSYDRNGSSVSSRYWMSVFDINRWYHSQMPQAVRCQGASMQVCPFWAVYDLEQIVGELPSRTLLNVEVNGRNIQRFINNNPVPPEEHSYPSALKFTGVHFVMSDGSVHGLCHGWQGQLLREMSISGGRHLVQPADFYHQCLRARLLSQTFEETRDRSTDYQRRTLLNMALEWGVALPLIAQCITAWEEGVFAEHGCTLSLLLNWAWDRVVATKQAMDSACTILYDWSGLRLDQRSSWQIAHQTHNLAQLKKIFTLFSIQTTPTTDRGQFELELRHEVVNILDQHYQTVGWAISAGFLPEVDETGDGLSGLFAFPLAELGQAYRNRRAELGTMNGAIEGASLLLIDSLVECQGPYIKQLWESFVGSSSYPPPSMQAMMNMYLIEEVSLEVKHAIMLYFLHDLAALDKSAEREVAVASFTQRFGLSPNLVHQVQGLWFIDHHDYEEGIRQLLNANVQKDLCEGWRREVVVNTLQAQGLSYLAMVYMDARPALGESLQEQELSISVLVSNRQIGYALEFLRGHNGEKTSSRLMSHLLQECHAKKLLGQLLQLSLLEGEESALEAHLRSRPEPDALEPLLLYYLHHSRFLQAFKLNQEMNTRNKLETSLAAQEKAVTRNRLVNAYLKVLPQVTRKMLTENLTTQTIVASARRVQVDRPKPLSTLVRQADFSGMSQAQFVTAAIDKINEAKMMLSEDEEDDEQNDLVEKQNSVMRDVIEEESRLEFPFLRTPQRKSVSRSALMAGTEASPVVKQPLSFSARKTNAMLETTDNQEEKRSLRELADECLKVLQTPVRDHKGRSLSPALASQRTDLKTPQSILKVRRLSKTFESSKDKKSIGSRRISGSRRLSASKSDTSHNISAEERTTPLAKSVKVDVPKEAMATPKQLRFIGVSPSPTPSPSPAPSSVQVVSVDVTSVGEPEESSQTLASPTTPPDQIAFPTGPDDRYSDSLQVLVRPDLQSPWKPLSPDQDSEVKVPTTCMSSSPVLPSPEPLNVRENIEKMVTEEQITITETSEKVTFSFKHEVMSSESKQMSAKQENLDFKESQDSSIFQKPMSPLLRPQRKSSSLSPKVSPKVSALVPLTVETTPPNASSTKPEESPPATPPSSKRAKMLVSAKEGDVDVPESRPTAEPTSAEEERETRRKSPGRRELSASDSTLVAVRTVASTEELVMEAGEGTLSRKQLTRDSGRESPVSGLRETPEQISPAVELPLRSDVEMKTSVRELKESPEQVMPGRQLRKTPERKTPARELRETPERKTPARELRETPERKTPLREVRESPERKASTRELRKTPERKSPTRELRETPERKTPARELRETPERKKPSRELRETPERKTPTRELRKIPERKTPLRELRKTPERKTPVRQVVEPVEEQSESTQKPPARELRKTPERKTPLRKLRETPERKMPSRELRQTPEKKTPARELQETAAQSSRGRKMRRISEEREVDPLDQSPQRSASPPVTRRKTPERKLKLTPREPSKNVSSSDQGNAAVEGTTLNEDPTAGITLRKSSRLNTPDRQQPSERKSLTPTRQLSQRGKTPSQESREPKETEVPEPQDQSGLLETFGSAGEVLDDDFAPSVSPEIVKRRRSARLNTPDRSVLDKAGAKNQTSSKPESDAELPGKLSRSRRQSKTPDRTLDKAEPVTPTRSSRRHKTAKVSTTDETEPVLESSESPVSPVAETEPATPPRADKQRGKNLSKNTVGKLTLSPSRRSTKKAALPERLDRDKPLPISPQTSPTRSKPGSLSVTAAADTTQKKGKRALMSVDDTGAAETFIFSPPVKHSVPGDEDVTAKEEDVNFEQFVFSKPSVMSPPPQSKPKRKRRPTRKSSQEDEVSLLPSPTAPVVNRSKGRARTLRESQRAAIYLRRKTVNKSYRLVPSKTAE